MSSLFAADMRQRFTLRRFLSVDKRGDRTYGAAELELPCKYEPSTRLLRDATGSQSVSTFILRTEVAVTTADLVTAPGQDPSDEDLARTPIRVDPHYDLESGQVDHYEVHC